MIFIPPWGTKPVRLPRYTNIESLWDIIATFLKEKVMSLSAFGILKISCGKQSTYLLIIIIYDVFQVYHRPFFLGKQVHFSHSLLSFISGSEDTLHTFKVQRQTAAASIMQGEKRGHGLKTHSLFQRHVTDIP